tara:strand:- start:97 stop:603 length:507 start_codon:yes stop_codon:yes gene_type:complete
MAHFAELDENNKVIRVVVVSNDIETAAGPLGENDGHVDGETWCENFFGGGTWKQCSYNADGSAGKFRKQYAGVGYTYDASKDKFIKKQPHSSWSLDGNDDWQAPVTYPSTTTYNYDPGGASTDYEIGWDEGNTRWIAKEWSGGTGEFYENPNSKDVYWDPGSSSWKDV